MADVDGQWPTEDEDFDATLAKAASDKTATKNKVRVVEADAEDSESNVELNDSQAEPEQVAETPQQDVPEESDQVVEPESPSEPESQSDAEPAEDFSNNDEKPQKQATTASEGRHTGRIIFEAFLVVIVIVLGLWSWTLYTDRNSLQDQVTKLNQNPQIAVQKQTDALIAKVGALMDLPKGESPTIASVSDAEQAKKQSAFFNTSQNGDKVLMYVKAGQAILYRPSTNKIILVAPLTFNNNTAKTSSTTTTPKTSTGTTTTR